MNRIYKPLFILFGFSWAITDSFVLVSYILTLLLVPFLGKPYPNFLRFRGDLILVSLVGWRLISAVKNGILSWGTLVKNVKLLFDLSPMLVFRNQDLLKYYLPLTLSFVFTLAFLTLFSFVELFGLKDIDFFANGMLEAFHRNHIKSGFAWSLGSLVVLILGIKLERRLLILLPILLVGLFYTQARSYYLGFMGGALGVFLLMGLKYSVRRLLSGLLPILLALPLGYLITPVRERFLSIFTGLQSDGSIKCRLIFLEEGLRAFKENPVFGIGFGGWQDFFLRLSEVKGYGCPNYHAHNIFMHEAVETGAVGLLILIAFLGYLVFYLSRAYMDEGEVRKEAVLLIGIASLLNFIVGSLFEPSLVKSVVLIPTFTLIGFALGAGYKLKSSS